MTQKLYINILKLLRNKFGNKVLWTDDIDRIMKLFFKNKALPTVPYDHYKPNGGISYCVINTDSSKENGEHWVAIYGNKNKLYIYDSFGRKTNYILKNFYNNMKKQGYEIIESKRDPEQADKQQDCGLRCISFLLVVKYSGIDNALLI